MKLLKRKLSQGNALVAVMLMIMISLIAVGAALSWTMSSQNMTYRHSQYTRTVAAAEAATEKAVIAINDDYKRYGQVYVVSNLNQYRAMVPKPNESSRWSKYKFTDAAGNADRIQVDYIQGTNLVEVSPKYKGLLGFPATFRVVATAREKNSSLNVNGAVKQEVLSSLIPIFQFAMFYNLDYECSALPLMTVNGPVHCNGNIHLTPWNGLTFRTNITATKQILRSPKSGNTKGGNGPVTYGGARDGGVSTLALPIGTNNTPAAVRQVIEMPPAGEDPNSTMGQQRLYNKADMIILVSNNSVRVTSGRMNNFTNIIGTNQYGSWLRTNVPIPFYNAREQKNILYTEIDIGRLRMWNTNTIATNNSLRPHLAYGDVRVIFIADFRSTNTTQPGIRLVNGQTNLPQGLTIASPQPVYIKGHYNCPVSAHLGTTNTTATVPCAILADAITVLSSAWNDGTSSGSLGSRNAVNTTVNAAFLAGIVETSTSTGYSGGVENFPRFLEEWTNRTLTYNGSMVVMYLSRYAVKPWVDINIYYNPPIRNWSFDTSFRNPLKLPPATPSAYALMRGTWNLASAP